MSEDMTDKVRVTIDVDVDSVDLSEELAQRVVDVSEAIDDLPGDSDFANETATRHTMGVDSTPQSFILLPEVRINAVDPDIFSDRITEIVDMGGFYARNIDRKDSYEGFDCWLSDDGTCGFAISPERELTNVFSLQNGRGKAMMQLATNLYDSLALNCFDGYLRKFYESCGFQEEHREDNYDGQGRDVVYMTYTLEA